MLLSRPRAHGHPTALPAQSEAHCGKSITLGCYTIVHCQYNRQICFRKAWPLWGKKEGLNEGLRLFQEIFGGISSVVQRQLWRHKRMTVNTTFVSLIPSWEFELFSIIFSWPPPQMKKGSSLLENVYNLCHHYNFDETLSFIPHEIARAGLCIPLHLAHYYQPAHICPPRGGGFS